MARIFTVDQLILRAQYAADMENQDFISDTEWKTLLSTAFAELHAMLVESGMRYFEIEQQYTSDGTNHSYDLPADFLTLVGIDFEANSANGERRPLQPLMVQERDIFTGVGSSTESVYYSLVGPKFRLYPTPVSGQVYYFLYAPQPKDMSDADGDLKVDVVTPDGEAFLTWHMAFRALAKEESDVSAARSEREEARARVFNWAQLRALHEPRRRIVQQGLGTTGALDPGDYWGRGGGSGW